MGTVIGNQAVGLMMAALEDVNVLFQFRVGELLPNPWTGILA